MNCSRCGRENPDGLKFCQDCGNRLNAPPAVPRPAQSTAAVAAVPAAAAMPPVGASTVVASAPVAAPQPPRPETAPRPAAPAFQFAPPTGVEKRCVRCGTGNPAQGRFCANCGSPLPGDGAG
ncbi:MAG TPA: zinc ribbon domain-containing protein, partial [Polyangiaceae bacterium]|nr:zinc ribbon domain-containing protein [Polyangiaceae bacterium]